MENNIFDQSGRFINTLNPSTVVKAGIYSEDQRKQINKLIHDNYFPHHTAVGRGKSTDKHWNIEEYRGKYGEGFKLITTSPYSSNFNHITYFIKVAI